MAPLLTPTAVVLALLAVLPTALSAPPTTSGTFSALTFNVAGLPAFLTGNDVPGSKTTNTARIGSLFTQYNHSIIHVQEDFNYHATLYANNDHPYRTPTSGGVPFGDGLNTLSVFDWVDFERVKWDECSNASGADCLTPKGFTFMRVKVSEGVWIDAYNLHTDAGVEPGDLTARASNLAQLSAYIATHSTTNPVLVFGDTNTRYTRAADTPHLFGTTNALTDAWIELVRNGSLPTTERVCTNPSPTTECEIVDKFWYRGSPAVSLQATSFQYAGDKYLQPDGNILSDHNPILVHLEWSLSHDFRLSDPWGGPHGKYYNDLTTLSTLKSAPKPVSITLRGMNRLDAVELKLASGETFTHGGTGGTPTTLTLEQGEVLNSATLCQAKHKNHARIFYLEVKTSTGRTVSAGKKSGDCVMREAEPLFIPRCKELVPGERMVHDSRLALASMQLSVTLRTSPHSLLSKHRTAVMTIEK